MQFSYQLCEIDTDKDTETTYLAHCLEVSRSECPWTLPLPPGVRCPHNNLRSPGDPSPKVLGALGGFPHRPVERAGPRRSQMPVPYIPQTLLPCLTRCVGWGRPFSQGPHRGGRSLSCWLELAGACSPGTSSRLTFLPVFLQPPDQLPPPELCPFSSLSDLQALRPNV